MREKLKLALLEINKVILDKSDHTKLILATWLMGGHVLLEDLPGTGKTVLAKCFAKVCHTNLGRVQFTPDLLPSDIIGITIYDQESKKFHFKKGPIFSTFFLADEINRATPRTQSALLEAMAEKQLTIENHTSKLSNHFFVMATQNPIESHGTFPLPEAQLDRFTIRISLGFLDSSSERTMIKARLINNPIDSIQTILCNDDFDIIKKEILNVRVDDSTIDYLIEIAHKTRHHIHIKHGVSPRATLAFTKLAQSYAYLSGREYVLPADIYKLAEPILNHRIILTESAIFEGLNSKDIITDIIKSIKPPKL